MLAPFANGGNVFVRAAGVGMAGATLAIALASPAFAAAPKEGEFCAKASAGQYATAQDGRTVQCTYGGSSDPFYRYRAATRPAAGSSESSSSSGSSTSSSSGSSGASTPTRVSSGSGGTADHSAPILPAALLAGAGLTLAGVSMRSLRRGSN